MVGSMLFWSVGVLLTNAYKVYLRVNEDEGVTKKSDGLLTHYEFRKSIALYWINPELVEKRNHLLGEVVEENSAVARCLNSPSTVSTLTGATFDSTSHPQCTPLSDASLKESAALGCRLDRTLPHIPTIAPSKKVKCSMHRWLGARKEGQLLYCPSCNVHLCARCYHDFHYISDLVGSKQMLIYKLQSAKYFSTDNNRDERNKKNRKKK